MRVKSILFGCFVFAPAVTMAEAWEVKPSVTLEGRYDDNIRLTTESPDKVSSMRAAGTLELAKLTEATEIKGLVRADTIQYSGDDRGLEHDDNQLVQFDSVNKDERSRLGFRASYKRDSLLRTIDAVYDPADVAVEPDETVDDALVNVSVRRNRALIRPVWTYHLTERTATTWRYTYNDVSYDDAEGLDLFDYRDHAFSGQINYRLSERNRVKLTLEGSNYRAPEPDNEYVSYAARGGYDYDWSETLRTSFEAGWYRTEFETPTEEGDDEGFLAGFASVKDAGLTEYALNLQRKLYPSGAGDLVQSDELVFNVTRELSERLRFTARARLFQNESFRDNPRVNRRYLSVEPIIRWSLTPAWSLDARYRYRRQKRDVDDQSADSNAVYISLNYIMPTAFD